MPTIHFMGFVEPRETKVCAMDLTPLYEIDKDSKAVTSYTVAIWDSIISVECEVPEFQPERISVLWTRSLELARTLVSLIGLRHGWGLLVHLDTVIHPDGTEERLLSHGGNLEGLIDVYGLEDIDLVFQSIGCDVDLSMAIHDMNEALSKPRTTAVNCARVLDTIRNLLAPGMKDKPGWRVVQEKLRADEDYLQYISKQSASSRHGKHDYVSLEDSEEILKRTWTLFNRYLYCRFQPQEEIPIERFPHLKSPKPQS